MTRSTRAAPLPALALCILAGCQGGKGEAGDDTAAEQPAPKEYEILPTGAAPWDPFLAVVDGVPTPPLIDGQEATEALADHEGVYAWRPAPYLAAGEYTLSIDDYEVAHEVIPYGIEEGFDAGAVVGRYYRLDLASGWYGRSGFLGDVLGNLVEDVWLQIEEVAEGEATFRVLIRWPDSEPCVALRAHGTLSETGELHWSRDELVVEVEQGDIPLEALSIHTGWRADGTEAGGTEAAVVLHTALLSQELLVTDEGTPQAPEALCEILAGFGTSCFDCRGDGPYCADLRLYAGQMALYDDVEGALAEPPFCSEDLDDAGDTDVSFDCAASMVGLLGLTGWFRRRRRAEAVVR